MRDSRYQNQRWWVKAYRQLRYRPKWAVSFIFYLGLWCIKGCRVPKELASYIKMSRLDYIRHMAQLYNSMLDIDLRYYYTADEVLDRLKIKYDRE